MNQIIQMKLLEHIIKNCFLSLNNSLIDALPNRLSNRIQYLKAITSPNYFLIVQGISEETGIRYIYAVVYLN